MDRGFWKKFLLGALACAAVSTVAFAGWKMTTNGPWRFRTNSWKVSGNGTMNDRDDLMNGVWAASAAGTHVTWQTEDCGVIKADWDPGFELYRTEAGFTIEFSRRSSADQTGWSWEWRDPE